MALANSEVPDQMPQKKLPLIQVSTFILRGFLILGDYYTFSGESFASLSIKQIVALIKNIKSYSLTHNI